MDRFMQVDRRGAKRRPGGLFWQRNFRLLWVGETASQLGSAMAAVAMPLLAVAVLHASTFTVTALTAAAYLPWLLIGLPAGAWIDRLDRRRLMVACDLISALLYGSLPVAAWLGDLGLGQVLLVALLGGAANVLFATAYQVFLPSIVPAGDLVEGNAKLQASSSASLIGGPGIAGLTAGALGAALALLANAASFLASAACLLAIDGEPARLPPAAPRRRLHQEIAEGVRYVTRDSYLRSLTIWAALTNLTLTGYTALAVVFLVRVVGLGPAAVGMLLAVSGLGGVLGALAAHRITRRYGTARTLLITAFAGMPAALLIPLTGAGWRLLFFLPGVLVTFGAVAVGAIVLSSFRQTYCPPHLLGRVIATMRFILYGASPFGAFLAGGLGTWFGIRNALWIMLSLAVLSGTCLLTPTFRHRRDLPLTSQ
jgi:MFS family permease